MQQIDNLTGVRAFAALSVMLLHVRYGRLADEYGPVSFIFQNRGLGVWVFFILSGFILAYVHHRDFDGGMTMRKVASFLWARLARIYPVHLFMLLLVAYALPKLGVLGRTIHDTDFALAANLLLVHGWGVVDNLTFNQASWSISTEWFAYLCFPALAFFTRYWRRAALVTLGIACIWISQELPIDGVKHGWYALSCLLHFTLGFVAYRAGANLPNGWPWRAGAIVLGPAIVFLFWLYPFIPDQFYYLFMAMTALLILCLFRAGPVFGFANPVSVYLGKVSYSLYMSHIITFVVLREVVRHGQPLPLWIELPAIILVAMALYHLVEQPARRWMLTLGQLRARTAPAQ